MRSTSAGGEAALEQAAAQSQAKAKHCAGQFLKLVFVFLLTAFSSHDDNRYENHRQYSGDELDGSLGHFAPVRSESEV
jgi:hypothetical protein